MGKKVYVASSFPHQKTKAAALADVLRANGYEVTARWLTVETPGNTEPGETYEVRTSKQSYAVMDTEDVLRSDAIVVITGDTLTRGGRHVEKGIAIGSNIPIINLGPRESVFDWHPLVVSVDTVGDVLAMLTTVPSRQVEEKKPEPLELDEDDTETLTKLLDSAPAEAAKVCVSYSGSGDDGSFEEAQVVGDGGTELNTSIDDGFQTFAEQLVERLHGGWENNEGGFGTVTFDIRKRQFLLEHSDYIEETVEHAYASDLPKAAG